MSDPPSPPRAFEAIRDAIQRDSSGLLDSSRVLIGFAGLRGAPASGRLEATLEVFEQFPEMSGIDAAFRDRVSRWIRTPRRLTRAKVNHFFLLEEKTEPGSLWDTTLIDLHPSKSRNPYLTNLLAAAPPSAPGLRTFVARNEVPRGAWAEERRRRFTVLKTELISRLETDFPCDVPPDHVRNLVDLFVYEYPEVFALVIPVLGAPVVSCYLAPGPSAFEKPPGHLVELHADLGRALTDAVQLFFFSELAELARRRLDDDSTSSFSPEALVAEFLHEAAGLLMARSLTIPPPPSYGLRWKEQRRAKALQKFKTGTILEVTLPPPWPPTPKAVFELPTYLTLPPKASRSSEAGASAGPQGDLVPASALPGVDGTARLAQGVLENLARFLVELKLRQVENNAMSKRLQAAGLELEKLRISLATTLGAVESTLAYGRLSEIERLWRIAMNHVANGQPTSDLLQKIQQFTGSAETTYLHLLTKLDEALDLAQAVSLKEQLASDVLETLGVAPSSDSEVKSLLGFFLRGAAVNRIEGDGANSSFLELAARKGSTLETFAGLLTGIPACPRAQVRLRTYAPVSVEVRPTQHASSLATLVAAMLLTSWCRTVQDPSAVVDYGKCPVLPHVVVTPVSRHDQMEELPSERLSEKEMPTTGDLNPEKFLHVVAAASRLKPLRANHGVISKDGFFIHWED